MTIYEISLLHSNIFETLYVTEETCALENELRIRNFPVHLLEYVTAAFTELRRSDSNQKSISTPDGDIVLYMAKHTLYT
jgi:hypothetical protein